MPDAPSTRSVLGLLTKNRLLELARDLQVAVPWSGKKDAQVDALLASGRLAFRGVVEKLGRDELRAACQVVHCLAATSHLPTQPAAPLLEAHGTKDTVPPRPLFAMATERRPPFENSIVQARDRRWLVEDRGIGRSKVYGRSVCSRRRGHHGPDLAHARPRTERLSRLNCDV